MAFFILMGLIAILIVYISVAKKKKRALLISVVILGMFHLYVRYSCGPNSADVKVMKPMAKAISNYIVKHGMPESLQDIPDLPYELVGCKRKVEYSNFDPNKLTTKIVNSKEKADFYNINEDCNFLYKNRIYDIKLDTGWSRNIEDISRGSIDIGNKQSHTWASLGFDLNSIGEVTIRYGFSFASSKNSGICKPWRQ